MSVDHGGGGEVPRIWSGDTNANCPPPQILSYCYKMSVCCLQNTPKSVSGRGSTRTLLGSSRHFISLPRRLGSGHPSHTSPYPLGTDPVLRRLPCVPQNSSQIYVCVPIPVTGNHIVTYMARKRVPKTSRNPAQYGFHVQSGAVRQQA